MEEKKISLTDKILKYLSSKPEGSSHLDLCSAIEANNEDLSEALNQLIQKYRIGVNEVKGEVNYRYISEKDASKIKNLSMEELEAYYRIIESGCDGVTTNDIKIKTNINTQVLNKILKKLENNSLIKSWKVANMRNRKIWIGFNIEPSSDITGGIWCNKTQGFDKNLISVMGDKVKSYIENVGTALRKEILIFVKASGLVSGDIKEDDLQSILNLLVFDDKLEVIFPEFLDLTHKHTILLKKNDPMLNNLKYKVARDYKPKAILNTIPCTYCQVYKECQLDNIINPKDCPFLNDFLKLFDV